MLNITQKKVTELIPYVNNSRTHSDEQVAQIAASIKEFGWTNPILVDGANGIIAGHGRLLAARKLGYTEVPTIELADLTETQKKAYIIADNRLALNAGWDNEMLTIELNDLLADGFALEMLGFDPKELNALLEPKVIEGLTDEDAVPDVPEEPKTRLGDIYQLGNHRLMCGDSTSVDAVEMLLDGEEADFMFTSPPYNAGKSESLSGNTHTTDNKYATYRDDKTRGDYLDFLCGFTNAWMWNTKCMAINIQQLAGNKVAFLEYLHKYKDHFIDMAIWNKGHGAPAMAANVMNSCFEYIIFLAQTENPSRAIPVSDFRGTVKNVYEGKPNRNNEFSKVHAATFPIDFPEWAITNFTQKKAIIADCFGGTGTTMIACEKHNRKARLMELDPKYCDVIVKRWEDFTGKTAVLLTELAESA
ncbi:MAG: DNA methyltransferase [Methylococcaceae bacterium]